MSYLGSLMLRIWYGNFDFHYHKKTRYPQLQGRSSAELPRAWMQTGAGGPQHDPERADWPHPELLLRPAARTVLHPEIGAVLQRHEDRAAERHEWFSECWGWQGDLQLIRLQTFGWSGFTQAINMIWRFDDLRRWLKFDIYLPKIKNWIIFS